MKYGFIGCGNMGGAIAKAIFTKTTDLAVTDRSGKAKALGFPYTSAEDIAAAEYDIGVFTADRFNTDLTGLAPVTPQHAILHPDAFAIRLGIATNALDRNRIVEGVDKGIRDHNILTVHDIHTIGVVTPLTKHMDVM